MGPLFYLLEFTFNYLFLNSVTDIKETATAVNFTLMKLVALQDEEGDRALRQNTTGDSEGNQLNLRNVLDVLTQYLMHNSVQTKVAVLQWIHHLHIKLPNQVSCFHIVSHDC